MIRTSENALNKTRTNLQKTKIKKNDRYKMLIHQIDLLKTTERQLKLKVKNLTNEINLINKNCLPYKCEQRSSSLSNNQRQHRSSSATKRLPSTADSHVRFNPTAYIHERNLKLRQIELQKKKKLVENLVLVDVVQIRISLMLV